MSLRERIEDNLTIWLLGTLFAGFMAGIGAYRAILEIAQLEVVPRAKVDELEGARLVAQKDGTKVRATDAQRLGSESIAEDVSSAQPTTTTFKLASKLPFPEHLDSIAPGMRLSEARTVFPDGKMTPGWYEVERNSGPFTRVAFFIFGSGENPKIDVVNLQFRDESAKRAVLSILLRELGNRPHRTEMLGERIVWPNVDGYELSVDESYSISLASTPGTSDE